MKIDVERMCAYCGQGEDNTGAYRCPQKPENIRICAGHLMREERRLFRKDPVISQKAGWQNLAHRLFKKSRCPLWEERMRNEKG